MARTKERLSPVDVTKLAKQVEAARAAETALDKSQLIHDGGGLYLAIDKRGPTASWLFRYMIDGKARTMGLGPLSDVGLSDARVKADEARRALKRDRVDPLERRDTERTAKRLEAAKAMTFRQCAEAYIASHRDGWKNAKHAAQWGSTLKAYAYPLIGALPVAAIDPGLVMKVLEQEVPAGPDKPLARLWTVKPETANRLRGRLEAVLGWAGARGLRSGDNPAVWKGQLQHQLPARSKVKQVEHHAALSYDEIHTFMASLASQSGMGARALEFLVLTAGRTNEVLGARWSEIDLAKAVWTIPGTRMKAGKEHRVPLSPAALAVLGKVKPSEIKPDAFVFPGAKPGRGLSNMAMLVLLRRMKRGDLTAHGFRSSFRDWGAEKTSFPNEVLEMALAHAVGDKTEAAYRRGDLFERRRDLADAWAKWCENGPPKGDNVADIKQARGAA